MTHEEFDLLIDAYGNAEVRAWLKLVPPQKAADAHQAIRAAFDVAKAEVPPEVAAELAELRKLADAVKAVVSAKRDMLDVHPDQFWMMHAAWGRAVDRLEVLSRSLFGDAQG